MTRSGARHRRLGAGRQRSGRVLVSAAWLLLVCAGLQAPLYAATSQVTVTLDPAVIAPDEAATLHITVRGDQDAYPIVPRVPGLQILPVDQSSSVQDINGVITATFSRNYRVTADRVGTFSIPPIQVGSFRSAPIILRVSAAGAGAGAASGAAGGAGAGAGTSGGGADADMPRSRGRDSGLSLPFMRIILPKTRLYVGEQVPIQIKAYFREGVGARLEGPLAATSDAFTVSALDKQPPQTEEMINGIPYAVLTWSSVLGAIKNGSYPLNLELPLTLNVMVTDPDAEQAARLRALFGNQMDAFMDDSDMAAMFGHVIQKAMTLKSQPASVQVLPLPEQGRPPDFAGAVGQFDAQSTLTPAGGAAGDPLTLKLTVSGAGNFSRVNWDGLPPSAAWRVYHPDAKLTADDDSDLRGLKSFSQPIVPLQAGHLQVPSLSFSYFDPQAGRYVTRRTAPIAVDVTPATGVAPAVTAAATPAASAAGQAAQAAAAGAPPAPRNSAIPAGRFFPTLKPLAQRRWFAFAAASPVLIMIIVLLGLQLRERLLGDPVRRRQAAHTAAVRRYLEAMDAALARGDPQEFFIGARHALQERLAQLWQISPEAVGEAQIDAKLQGEGTALRTIFATAEKAAYARASISAQELRRWQQLVHEQLQRLEAA